MQKISLCLAGALAMLGATCASAENGNAEIGYERGALGFEALMANDNEMALRQIQSAKSVPHNDPARLINLGRAHARLGNDGQARQAFEADGAGRERRDR